MGSDIVENDTGIAGIVFVLPRDMDTKLPDGEDIAQFREIEGLLLSLSIPCPVYFVFDSDDIETMVSKETSPKMPPFFCCSAIILGVSLRQQ